MLRLINAVDNHYPGRCPPRDNSPEGSGPHKGQSSPGYEAWPGLANQQIRPGPVSSAPAGKTEGREVMKKYTAQEAAELFLARKDRKVHPDGDFDRAGRWYPSESEKCDCCSGIRSPSRSYPYSYMVHCRTKAHVSCLTGIPVKDINAALRNLQGGKTVKKACNNGIAYKKLAVENGRLVSVYDGSPWYLRQERVDAAKQNHSGGLYVYETRFEALHAPFPEDSSHRDHPKVIVKVKVSGKYCRYEHGKLAFSRVTPLTVVEIL